MYECLVRLLLGTVGEGWYGKPSHGGKNWLEAERPKECWQQGIYLFIYIFIYLYIYIFIYLLIY